MPAPQAPRRRQREGAAPRQCNRPIRNRAARSYKALKRGQKRSAWMSPCPDNDQNLPDELRDVVRQLREERTAPSAGELDELKLRVLARARARSSRTNGRLTMKSRALIA